MKVTLSLSLLAKAWKIAMRPKYFLFFVSRENYSCRVRTEALYKKRRREKAAKAHQHILSVYRPCRNTLGTHDPKMRVTAMQTLLLLPALRNSNYALACVLCLVKSLYGKNLRPSHQNSPHVYIISSVYTVKHCTLKRLVVTSDLHFLLYLSKIYIKKKNTAKRVMLLC